MKKLQLFNYLCSGLVFVCSLTVQADDFIPKSTYNWTGVYVGGFVGGASGANVTGSGPTDSNGNTWNANSLASAYGNNYSTGGSFMGGGTLGYNWQFKETPYVLGVEAEYGYIGMSGSNPDPNNAQWNTFANNSNEQYENTQGYVPLPLSNGKASTKIGSDYGYGLIGGRIGYSMERALIYIKSGAVFTSTQTEYSDSNANFYIKEKSNNDAGYALGAGLEYALPFEWTKNISVKTEYLYFGLNKSTTGSVQNINSPVPYSYTTNIDGIHTAKVGVNYKF